MNKLLHPLGIIACFLVSFRVGMAAHFPTTSIIERIQWEVQNKSNSSWALELDGLSLNGMLGLKGQNIRLLHRQNVKQDHEELLFFDYVKANISSLSLLAGAPSATLSTEFLQGSLSAEIGQEKEDMVSLDLSGEDLSLALLPIQGENWSLELLGLLQAEISLRHHLTDLKEGSGSIEVSADDLVLEGGEFQGFELIEMQFSEANFHFERDGDRLEVREGLMVSEPLQAELTGHIKMNKRLERSRLHLQLKLQFSEELDKLAKLAPPLKKARQADGSYLFTISGTMNRPIFREEKKKKSPTPSKRPTTRGENTDNEEPMEADDRREKRRERLKKRREDRKVNMDNGRGNRPGVKPPFERMPKPMEMDEGPEEEMEDEEEYIDDEGQDDDIIYEPSNDEEPSEDEQYMDDEDLSDE
jgi:type II secretion system protein N